MPGGKSLVHWIKAGTPFSLQFGRYHFPLLFRVSHNVPSAAHPLTSSLGSSLHRETVAVLLNAPDRADWKRCAKPDAEEKKDAQRFKQAFKSFDPST
ncbi:MAG: hypothetical protein LBE44_00710 [Microbacterium hominis]|nr:hypothetical protein [Microbacterium hominis]